MPRTDQNLKGTLLKLGLRQSELALLLDVSPRTVSQWSTGDVTLPGPVAAYLRVLQCLSASQQAEEFARIEGRTKMLDEGIYGLSYRSGECCEPAADSALAVLRAGKVLGSDRWGGVFSGSYEFDNKREINTLHVRLRIPADGELVTGFTAGPEGATVDIVGAFARAAPMTTATVDVAGQPVEVQLRYLGPLPN